MFKKISIAVAFTLSSFWACGQQEAIFKDANVIAPSPSATAFNQFIDTPVGHYTGIPNIGVPIYTLQLPQFSLPISLNYHAGGLKVGDHSTWVGAGWSLNAGGAINRTVRGLPDEYSGPVRTGECEEHSFGYLRLDTKYFDEGLTGVSERYLLNTPYITGKSPADFKGTCPISGCFLYFCCCRNY